MTGIQVEDMLKGDLTDNQITILQTALSEIHDFPIFIFDDKRSIAEIISTTRFLKRKHGVDFVVVDYLQLVDSGIKSNNRNQQIEAISRKLKVLATPADCNLTCLVLSQLSRDVEKREDKRPFLSDLRDSGAIEQDADMVQFVYRDSYYNDNGSKETEILIRKNRHGRQGKLIRTFDNRKFIELF